ncbi:MAG: hypothetical protein M5U19_07125 [Microthrixaceae bacterium]|nr:hypothetical protein [Microthrixaceae bacterium]
MLLAVGVMALITVLAIVIGVNVFAGSSDSDPVGAGHVHSLGVNDADGSIVIASHAGLLRVDPETQDSERVGGRYRDMMGFEVVGPDEFLASGHPDVQGMVDGDPGQLGLLRSTDGGLNWQTLSLSGAADLHELVVAGDSVLAWDSLTSELMVSEDLVSWETLSTIELSDLAVDPDRPEHLIAATETGTMRSINGGRSWEPLDGPGTSAGRMVLGDWAIRSRRRRRALERARSWLVSRWLGAWGGPGVGGGGQTLLVAVWDAEEVTEVYSSDDEGQTWSRVFRDSSGHG